MDLSPTVPAPASGRQTTCRQTSRGRPLLAVLLVLLVLLVLVLLVLLPLLPVLWWLASILLGICMRNPNQKINPKDQP